MKSKIFWKFFASFAFVTSLSLLALYFYLIPTLRQFLLHEIEKTSVEKAALIRDRIDTLPPKEWTIENLDPLADRLGNEIHARVTLLDKNGEVFGDSDLTIQEVEKIENHLTRPEIQAALHQEYGAEVRYSTTVKEELMYVALKTSQGFVRVALPIQVLQQTVTHVKQSVLVAALVALLLGSGAGLFFSRSFSQNIGQILTELRKLEDIRREFVANVSHELKTPLTSIRGYAETLRGGALKDEEAAKRFLKKIEDNALRLQNLVEDILKLSQIESGRMEFHAKSFLLAPFLTDLCHEFEERALKRRISFSQQISELLPLLSVDPKVLRQIIGNLVDNAFQYTQEGGKVEITAKVQEKEIALSITDNGIGISPENLSRIFERFYRVDKAHTRGNGGTGLGLSIVKHLVQAHGWEIGAQSQVGKGSIFTVIIPLLQTKIYA